MESVNERILGEMRKSEPALFKLSGPSIIGTSQGISTHIVL